MAQTTSVSFTTTGAQTWTAPCGVTSITVECWGGGGAGGGATTANPAAGGGGSGGAYTLATYTVVPGTTYNLSVGAGGANSTGAGGSGGSSWFNSNTTILAVGGLGGTNTTTTTPGAGAAAVTSGNIGGTVNFYGGAGGTGATNATGGGGGSSAGNASNGNNATSGTGGAVVTGGGAGANGQTGNANGAAGSAPGGGGAGARRTSGSRSGGAGGKGQVVITYVQVSANAPTGLTATAITPSSAQLNWTAPSGSVTSYTLLWRLSPSGAWDTVTNITGTSYSLSGLAANTAYDFEVADSNGTPCASPYSSIYTFTTLCSYITSFPYLESFNSASTLPACWTASNNGGGFINWATTTSDGNYGVSGPEAGSSFLYLDVYDGESNYNPYIVTTPSIVLGSVPKQLSYYYFLGSYGYTGSPDPLDILISTDGGNTWNQIYGHNSSNSVFSGNNSTSGWTQNTINLTPYANDTIMIRFSGNSNYGFSTCDIGIDEVLIQNAPTCYPPTALNTPTVGGTNATFNWTPPIYGAPYGYLWEVRTSGAGGSGASGLVASDSTLSTTDSTNALAPLTTYNLYVSSECDTTLGSSTWAGPFTFTTTFLPCSGNPTAGTAIATSVGVCSASLGLTGTTTGYTGITYQWQVSFPSGSGNFTNIAGATYDTVTALLLGAVSDFRCVAICGNSGGSDTSSIITITASPGTAGGFSPVAVTGFNQDVIANGNNNHSANPPSLSTTTTVDAPNGYDFYDASYSFNGTTYPTTSLPVNGQVVSNSITGLLYQLQSATTSNVLQLRGGGGAGTTLTGTLTLTTPQSGTEVYLLGVSGNGASTMNAVVNFTDGSSQTFTGINVDDWFNGTPYSQGGFGRVNSTGFDAGAPGGNNPRMYDLPLALAPSNYSKLVQSIDITNASSGAAAGSDILNIFAVTMAVPNPASFCGGLATSVSLFNYASGGVTYQWESSTTSGGPYTNVTTGSGATTTTYTNSSTGSIYYVCQGTCTATGLTAISNEVNVNINPAVTVSVTPSTVNYCSGGQGVTLSAIAVPGLTYSWSPSAGLSSTRDSSVVATPSATTTYTVTAFNSGGCSNTASATVNYVIAPVVSEITASPSSLCAGDSSYINVVASTPAPAYCIPSISDAYLHYLGSFNLTDTTGTITYVTTTNPYSPGTPNNYVDHGAASTTGSLVAGTTYDFNGTYGGSYEGLAIWIDFNQNGVFENNELLYAAYGGGSNGGTPFSGNFLIPTSALNGTTKMRVRDGWGSDTIPDANGVYSCGPGNTDGFNTYGETDDYTITITGGVNSASLTYSWSPVGTLTSSNTSNTVAAPLIGTTTYTVTVSNGICSVTDSVTDTVGVVLAIAPTATTTATPPYCSGSTTYQLSANRTGGGAPFTYTWTSVPAGFTSSASIVSVTPDTTTTYYLTVRDTCGSVVTDSVIATVIQTPVLSLTPVSSTYCSGGTADMLVAGGAASFSWNPSSSLSSSTGDTVYASPSSTTTYSVTGTTLGCSSTAYAIVTVTSAPVISMVSTTPPNPSICAGHQSQLDVVASTTYTYCIPSISNTYLHYLGSFYLTDTIGVNTYVSTSNAFSPGTANNYTDHGTANTTGSLAAGNRYDFNGSYGGAYEGLAVWIDFNQNGVFENNELLYAAYGGGSTGGTPFSGSFVIPPTALSGTTKMRVRDGWGSDTIPDANGQYSCSPGNTDGFSTYGETDDYTITITGGATPGYLSYTWTPSGSLNNANVANPVAAPSVTTGYTVVVTDSSTGCSASSTDTVTITPAIALTDSVSGPTDTVCAGVRSILSVSASGGCTPYRYAWSPVGAGVSSSASDTIQPLVTTIYTVTVTDSSGSQVTSTYTVNVANPRVTATTPGSVCGAAGAVTLVATASSGASIVWADSIGGAVIANGDTFSTVPDSTRTYYAFAVSTSPVCQSAGTSVVASVYTNPALTLNNNLVITCAGTVEPVTITSSLPSHSSYVWTPATGLYTNAAGTTAYTGGNASSLYGVPTISTGYTVVLFDSATGCSSNAKDSFSIYQLPTARFIGSDTSVCPGAILTESIVFTGTGPWIFTHTTDEAVSPVTATSQTSTYTFSDTPTVSGSIRLTNLSDAHCPADYSGLDSIVVTINPITASFTASQTYIHLGDSVVFTSTSAGAVSYRWTFGDGDSSSVSDPVHTYGATGVYTVTLTVINANGCSSTISKLDTVTFPLGISKVPDEKMFNIYSYQNRVMVDFSQFTTVDATIQIYNVLGQVLSNDTYHSADTYEKPLDLDAAYVIVRVRMSDGQVAAKKLFIYK